MLLVQEYDEDPTHALQQQQQLLQPRRTFQVQIQVPSSTSTAAASPYSNTNTTDAATTTKTSTTATTITEIKETTGTTTATVTRSFSSLVTSPRRIARDLFLPLGYPHTVRSEYWSYQVCDSVQGLCSYLRGVVSTSAVLEASGVGNIEATALGAAANWALRDGLGMLGGLIFSYCASSHFDALVLEFRLFADIINNVGLLLDMMAPLITNAGLLLTVMSLSTLCKTVCGMSAGATKASITCHLALEGNMADLNAKEGTQETLVSLVGMVLGVLLARFLNRLRQQYEQQPWMLDSIGSSIKVPVELGVSWTIFFLLTGIHMWANYKGVQLLKLRSLNRERTTEALNGLVEKLSRQGDTIANNKNTTTTNANNKLFQLLLPPNKVQMHMLQATFNLLFPQQQSIVLGVSLLQILQQVNENNEDTNQLLLEFQNEKYIIGISFGDKQQQGHPLSSSQRVSHQRDTKKFKVLATLRTGATPRDELQAFLHCLLLRKCLDNSTMGNNKGFSKNNDPTSSSLQLIQRYVLFLCDF